MLGSSARSCAPKISKEISKISMLVNNIKEKGPEEYGRMNITKILKIFITCNWFWFIIVVFTEI